MKSRNTLLEPSPDSGAWLLAWERVKENHGCAGSDGVSIEQFGSRLKEELEQLSDELECGTYRPWPLLEIEAEEVIRRGGFGGS